MNASVYNIKMNYLTADNPTDALDALNAQGVSRTLFRKAAAELNEANPEKAATMVQWVEQTFGMVGERGRPGPEVGEVRDYSTQESPQGQAYIRVPVDLLGAAKQAKVRAVFQDGQISLVLAPND